MSAGTLKKSVFALLLSLLIAAPAAAQTAVTLPYAAQSVADIGNGPIKVRVTQGNASIFTAQGSGIGSTAGASTSLTLTAVPTTPPIVGGLISGGGIVSGTSVVAYDGATSVTLSAIATVTPATPVAWGAACPSSAAGIPSQYIQGSVSADYYLLYTQARVCAISPGGSNNALLVLPVFYDKSNVVFGSMAFQSSNAVDITGGSITGMPNPVFSSDVANKKYVDTFAAGFHVHPAVDYATTTALANSPTYDNGTLGVGATLTEGSNGALSVDSSSPTVGQRVIVKDQTSTTGCNAGAEVGCQNGAYVVTAVGDASNPYVLTRSTDAETADELSGGDAFLVLGGTVNMGSSWANTSHVTAMGTTGIIFVQFATGDRDDPWQISGSNIFFNAGNVGIGTNSPGQSLDVVGGIRFRSLLSGCLSTGGTGVLAIISCGGSYVAPGTGGVSIPISQHLQKNLWADEYGAACNGSTDDHVAFQNMINEAQTLGSVANFTGHCVTGTALSISGAKGIIFQGTGYETSWFTISPSIRFMNVSSSGGNIIRQFLLEEPTQAPCGGTPATGTAGIVFDSATDTNVIEDVQSNCVGPLVRFDNTSQFHANRIRAGQIPAGEFGVEIGNTGYSGDGEITASIFGGTSSAGAVYCSQCAGLRFINNKILGSGMSYGFYMQIPNAFADGDLFITGNSFEGISGDSIFLQRAGATGGFGTVSITGNELTGNIGIYIPTDPNGVWLTNIAVSGNTFSTSGAAASIDTVRSLIIAGNAIYCTAGNGIVLGPGVDRGVIGPNASSNVGGSAYCALGSGGTNMTYYSP